MVQVASTVEFARGRLALVAAFVVASVSTADREHAAISAAALDLRVPEDATAARVPVRYPGACREDNENFESALACGIAPQRTGALVSLRPKDSAARDLQLIVREDRVVVFDPFGGGVIVATAVDPMAIEAAVRGVAAGNRVTVTVHASSPHNAPMTFGALARALAAAQASGADVVAYGEYDSHMRPALDALDDGDIKPALVTLRALSATESLRGDAWKLIDPVDVLVEAKARPAWNKWLDAHHLLAVGERKRSTRAAFDEVVARRRHERGRVAPDHVSWGPSEDRDLDALAGIKIADVPYAIGVIASGVLPIDLASNTLTRLFAHGDTRAVAWTAVRRNAQALAKVFDWWSSTLVDGMSLLCEPTSKMEAVGAFALLDLQGIDQALAAIDDCVARRSRIGDFAAVLAGLPE